MNRIELEAHFRATPEAIWPLLADHERMVEWLPVREVVRRRAGHPDPNGVGAVRTIRGGVLVVEEQIVDFKPNERLEYVLIRGAPVRDQRGEVALARDGEWTRVRWSVCFRPLVPGTGWLIALLLRHALERGFDGLRRLVESR